MTSHNSIMDPSRKKRRGDDLRRSWRDGFTGAMEKGGWGEEDAEDRIL
jgi:hypothetical protein